MLRQLSSYKSRQEMRTLGSPELSFMASPTLYIVSQKATINNTYDTKDKTTDLILSLLPQNKRTTKLRNKIQLSTGFTKTNKHEDNN